MQSYTVKKILSCTLYFLFLVALSFANAQAQGDQQVEYKPVLKLDMKGVNETLPEGWQVVVGEAASDSTVADSSLWHFENEGQEIAFMPQTQPVSLTSPVLTLEDSCTALSGVVLGSGSNQVDAQIQWMSKGVVLDTITLLEPPISNESSRRFNLADAKRPKGADAAQFLLTVHPDNANSPFRCAAVNLTAALSSVQSVSVYCNKIGYEQVGPKKFTVRANFMAQQARFSLDDALGQQVFNGDLSLGKHIQGDSGTEWEDYYYRGDFSLFGEEGEYVLTVELDQNEALSVPIRIGFNLFIEKAFALTLTPFKHLRMDSAEDNGSLALWNPAFAGDTTDAALLWDIVRSWSILKGIFGNHPAFAPLHEEALFGLERVAQWVLQQDKAVSDDLVQEMYYAAALACGTRLLPDNPTLRHAATLLAERAMNKKLEGILPFSVVMDLYEATQEDRYLEYAQNIFPGISLNRIEPLLDYETHTGELVTVPLSNMFSKAADQIIKNADNPFGLTKAVEKGQRGFFLWSPDAKTPLKGGNTRILAAVEFMAQAYRYTANGAYRDFAYDQLNWVLGNNPHDTCLIVGLCKPDIPPAVLPEGWTDEDAHGFVIHGIGPREAEVDCPEFPVNKEEINENTHGFSLYNNARYISAMAYLKRIYVAPPLNDTRQ